MKRIQVFWERGSTARVMQRAHVRVIVNPRRAIIEASDMHDREMAISPANVIPCPRSQTLLLQRKSKQIAIPHTARCKDINVDDDDDNDLISSFLDGARDVALGRVAVHSSTLSQAETLSLWEKAACLLEERKLLARCPKEAKTVSLLKNTAY